MNQHVDDGRAVHVNQTVALAFNTRGQYSAHLFDGINDFLLMKQTTEHEGIFSLKNTS